MIKRFVLILTLILVTYLHVSAQSDLTLHSVKFIGDTQFLVVDGDGMHSHPFLLADIIFVGDAQPLDGNQLTIGDVTFTFRDLASGPYEIQIGGNIDSTVDNTMDVINSSHVVLRTSRHDNRITLVAAETAGLALSTTASGHAITVTSFNSCGAP